MEIIAFYRIPTGSPFDPHLETLYTLTQTDIQANWGRSIVKKNIAIIQNCAVCKDIELHDLGMAFWIYRPEHQN